MERPDEAPLIDRDLSGHNRERRPSETLGKAHPLNTSHHMHRHEVSSGREAFNRKSTWLFPYPHTIMTHLSTPHPHNKTLRKDVHTERSPGTHRCSVSGAVQCRPLLGHEYLCMDSYCFLPVYTKQIMAEVAIISPVLVVRIIICIVPRGVLEVKTPATWKTTVCVTHESRKFYQAPKRSNLKCPRHNISSNQRTVPVKPKLKSMVTGYLMLSHHF